MNMYSRLQSDLEKILVSFNISHETNIFNEIIMKLAHIPVNIGDVFGFDPYHSISSNEDELLFIVPPLNLDDLYRLLDFMRISRENYKVGEPLVILEEMLFKNLLQKFEDYINATMEKSPYELNSYVLKSKPILEAKAIKKIEDATKDLLIKVYDSSQEGLSTPNIMLTAYLQHLLFILKHLKLDFQLYSRIITYKNLLLVFFDTNPEYEEQIYFLKDINLLKEGFANYIKFNRVESIIAVNTFFKELPEFTASHNIDSGKCDIFADFLMNKAHIHQKPKLCTFTSGKNRGADPTRIIFSIVGIDAEDAKKFVDFFHEVGDETAKECYSINRQHTSITTHHKSSSNKKKISWEKHLFEVDGLIFYKIIFPQFKEEINECIKKNPEQLKSYKDMCALNNIIEKIDSLVNALDSSEILIASKNNLSYMLQKGWMKQVLNKLTTTRTLICRYNLTNFNAFVSELIDVIYSFNKYKMHDIVKENINLTKLFSDFIESCYACKKQITQMAFIKLDDKVEVDGEDVNYPFASMANISGATLFSTKQHLSVNTPESKNDDKSSTIHMYTNKH